jgi:hypothetical protein
MLVRKINETRSEREHPMNIEKSRVWFITGASTGLRWQPSQKVIAWLLPHGISRT